jgi:1-acyl-sn-glycerol-3-phosphate acyltransferase
MPFFARASAHCFRLFFKTFYRHTVIFEEKPLPQKGVIIAANHVSFLDPPLISGSWDGELYFLARRSLFENPFLGLLLRQLNSVPVGMGSDAIKIAYRLLREGKSIVIFPEGTRSETGELGTFRNGIGLIARETGAPIIPTYIFGTHEIWPKERRLPHLFGKRSGCIFGRPLFAHRDEDPKTITERVFEEVRELRYLHENT